MECWKMEDDRIFFVEEIQIYGISNIQTQSPPPLLPLYYSTESKFKSALKKTNNILTQKCKHLITKNNKNILKNISSFQLDGMANRKWKLWNPKKKPIQQIDQK